MKCDVCGDRMAVFFVQQITKEASVELHLCETCAKERGFATAEDSIDISLNGIFKSAASIDGGESAKGSTCPACGFSLKEIKRQLRVGCAICYRHFRGEIISLMRHEGVEFSYQGQLPPKLKEFGTRKIDPDSLRRELKKAIDREDYELAAYYRDRLRSIGEAQ